MTLFQVSFANESEPAAFGVPCLDGCSKSKANSGGRRFNLKKRSSDQSKTALSSYNSAFLSGLFADVARASSSQDEEETPATFMDDSSSTATEEEIRLDHTLSSKRSRVSLTKSLSRCARSCKSLAEAASPVGVDAFESEAVTSYFDLKSIAPGCSPSMDRMNSLHFQLNCVDPSPSPKSVKSVIDIIDMAFPHLPATVSDSSCSRSESPKQLLRQQDLTHESDQQVSDSETSSSPAANVTGDKDSYGWFVELDGDDDSDQDLSVDPYQRTSSSVDLAFTAPTAPKRINNAEAEVEWAKAADTVDDVLGDFF